MGNQDTKYVRNRSRNQKNLNSEKVEKVKRRLGSQTERKVPEKKLQFTVFMCRVHMLVFLHIVSSAATIVIKLLQNLG